MPDPQLAVLWLDALQRIAGFAAHEVNNALNGAVVNLEVVRVRAQPGADAGRVAAFAEAAAEQVGGTAALTAAFLALTRAPPNEGADVAVVARHIVTLLTPAFAHQGVVLVLEAADRAPVAGDPVAVRAAIAVTLLCAVELAGAKPAGDPRPLIRCTVSAGPPIVVDVATTEPVTLPRGAASTLRVAGADVVGHARGATITFRAAGDGT